LQHLKDKGNWFTKAADYIMIPRHWYDQSKQA